MSLTFCTIPLPQALLKYATKVSVTIGQHNDLPAGNGNRVKEFAICVGAAPHIISIEFDRLLPVTGSMVSLDSLLSHLTEPIQLQRLALNCCMVRMDPHIQHLRHLTSLKLTHVPHPRSSNHLLDLASLHAEIWNTFTQHEIKLQEITLDKVVPELVTYLASYSGLTVFEVRLPHDSGSSSSNEGLGSRFYKALHQHSKSLRNLKIHPFDSGPWCYDPVSELRQLVSICTNLKSLFVTLVPDHNTSVTTKTIVVRTPFERFAVTLLKDPNRVTCSTSSSYTFLSFKPSQSTLGTDDYPKFRLI